MTQAAAFDAKGKLTTGAVMRMAADGLSTMIVGALAHRARLDVSVVAEVVRAASAKGMRSVAWAADFNADDAFTLQIKVAVSLPAKR